MKASQPYRPNISAHYSAEWFLDVASQLNVAGESTGLVQFGLLGAAILDAVAGRIGTDRIAAHAEFARRAAIGWNSTLLSAAHSALLACC